RRVESPRRPDEVVPAIVRAVDDVFAGRPQPAAVEIPIGLQHGDAPMYDGEVPRRRPVAPDAAALASAAEPVRGASKRVLWARGLIGPDYEAIMDHMREMLPRDAPIVRDSTVPAYMWGDRLLPVYEPGTSISPTSAAIGPGLALAIGAAAGARKPTLVIHADG